MTPSISPTDYPRLLDLFWEFSKYIEQLHTLYLDSLVGYSILHERLQDYQGSMRKLHGEHEYGTEKFQDTCSMLYKDLSNMDYTAVAMSPVMKQGDIKRRIVHDGQNTLLLGRQCVVSAYAYWEEYLRIEVGKALGVLKLEARANEETRKILNRYVVSDFWGDMRHIRHSIVHANGIATDEVKTCQIIKWFAPGDRIDLPHERMHRIFILMGKYRNELHKMSLPKRGFCISP